MLKQHYPPVDDTGDNLRSVSETNALSQNPSSQSLVPSNSRPQFISQYPSDHQVTNFNHPPESGENAMIFQGNATAVVRVLKELHAQRQFMQNSVVLIAK